MKPLVLIELNEINFDIVQKYQKDGLELPSFERIMSGNFIKTQSEIQYEQLEPWIQWPSVHTGLSYNEHGIFRLGDAVLSDCKQVFELVESRGYQVGVISAMNAPNRLQNPSYFIPDPWIKTPSDGSFHSRNLHEAISQAVNDNAQTRITLKSLLALAISFISLISISKYLSFIKFAISAKGKSWRKALFLDMFLAEVHDNFFHKKQTQFSTLFLNAGAHIQHHYLFNSLENSNTSITNPKWYIDSKMDPFREMLIVYDKILEKYLANDEIEVIIATGLSQKLHQNITFYYRLKNHKQFLEQLGIEFTDVRPRMTRDFLITFANKEDTAIAAEKLSSLHLDGKRIFGELDNRGCDLFAVLTYDEEILPDAVIELGGGSLSLNDFVTFVAIKNGEHQGIGFAYFSNGLSGKIPSNNSNITEIHETILSHFEAT